MRLSRERDGAGVPWASWPARCAGAIRAVVGCGRRLEIGALQRWSIRATGSMDTLDRDLGSDRLDARNEPIAWTNFSIFSTF